MKKNTCENKEYLGKVGGEAVLEGVMMKSGDLCATACRNNNGKIVVKKSTYTSVRKKHKILNFPIIRGVVNFIETMKISMEALNTSSEVMGIEEETKFEKWLKSKFGVAITDFISVVATILGFLLAIVLFLFIPTKIAQGFNVLTSDATKPYMALIEGASKIIIFVTYIWLVSLLPDIRRTFMYHGAEHKSIACFESGVELTPENAKEYTRFHPRCGTSFMFVMILIGIIIGLFIPTSLHSLVRTAIKLCLLPLVIGIGYEFIMFAGKHNNIFVKIVSAPGLLMQRLTTKEPTLDQLEVAITALKSAMPALFPDFSVDQKEEAETENSEPLESREENTVKDNEEKIAEETIENDVEGANG